MMLFFVCVSSNAYSHSVHVMVKCPFNVKKNCHICDVVNYYGKNKSAKSECDVYTKTNYYRFQLVFLCMSYVRITTSIENLNKCDKNSVSIKLLDVNDYLSRTQRGVNLSVLTGGRLSSSQQQVGNMKNDNV